MEIFISMKAEDMSTTVFRNSMMDIPSAQNNGFFIAELRESSENKVRLLHRYAEILINKLNTNGDYGIEYTTLGFKLKRKVDENKEYMEEWERWVQFSRDLYEELEKFLYNE